MKTLTTSTTVILKAIDFELKALLQKDLERFKTDKHNNQSAIKKAA